MALRAELAAIDPSRSCDRRAESAGLGSAAPSREGPVTRLAVRLGRGRPGSGTDRSAAAPDVAGTAREFDWDGAAEHCRLAWLRGLFLARGSLSLASGRTHLEFVVAIDEAETLVDRLAAMDLPASWRIRRGRGVVTWKSGETVGPVPAPDRRRRGAPRGRGAAGLAGPAGRPEPGPERRVGEPAAGRRSGGPPDRGDRRARR